MSGLELERLVAGLELPSRRHVASNVSLFTYNAAVWNPHRIHYDERYTTEQENHPGIVIDGPLQGDWLWQCVANWVGDAGRVIRFEYSNRRAAYLGETLTTGGSVASVADDGTVEVDLFVANESGEVITPGGATVLVDA